MVTGIESLHPYDLFVPIMSALYLFSESNFSPAEGSVTEASNLCVLQL